MDRENIVAAAELGRLFGFLALVRDNTHEMSDAFGHHFTLEEKEMFEGIAATSNKLMNELMKKIDQC